MGEVVWIAVVGIVLALVALYALYVRKQVPKPLEAQPEPRHESDLPVYDQTVNEILLDPKKVEFESQRPRWTNEH